MPVHFASFDYCLLLAVMGGVLHFAVRRYLTVWSATAVCRWSSNQFSCASKPPGPAASSGSRPPSSSPFPPRAAGELVLLVEDDANVRNMLSTVLQNHGYEVITARDGVEALGVFRRHQDRVVLVITDINMPKGNGRVLAESLRALRPDVLILFMSGLESNGSGRDPDAKRSKFPFLLKPFKPAAMLKAAHALLHPTAPRP
jgi:CheY-like chemotaxis protein